MILQQIPTKRFLQIFVLSTLLLMPLSAYPSDGILNEDKTWQPLKGNFDGNIHQVYEMQVVDSDLYVLAKITFEDTEYEKAIVRYNSEDEQWDFVVDTLDNHDFWPIETVLTFLVVDDEIYVSGREPDIFTYYNARVLTYNLETGDWGSRYGNNTNDRNTGFTTLIPYGDKILAAGSTPSFRIYDPVENNWEAYGNTANVNDMVIHDDKVYLTGEISGVFIPNDDSPEGNFRLIAGFNLEDKTWFPLDEGMSGSGQAFGRSLGVVNESIYVSGAFWNASGVENTASLARYDTEGNSWHQVSEQGNATHVHAIEGIDGMLYVGGDFELERGGQQLTRVAMLNSETEEWHAMGCGATDLFVHQIAHFNGEIIIAGEVLTDEDGLGMSILRYTTDMEVEPVLNCDEIGVSTEPEESNIPNAITLEQNYPNPFNPTTVIEFTLPQTSNVRLEVFNIAGQRVATLANETRQAGVHQVDFDASHIASGVYFYRLETGSNVMTRSMMLIK